MSTATKAMTWAEADILMNQVIKELRPHCEPGRCVGAGSWRRQKAYVHDLEIVMIPKPYDSSEMFANGIARIVNGWEFVQGTLPCKNARRILPTGQQVDIYMPNEDNWGWILAIRTGSHRFVQEVLINELHKKRHTSRDGMVQPFHGLSGVVSLREEEDVFRFLGIPWVAPEERI